MQFKIVFNDNFFYNSNCEQLINGLSAIGFK